MRKSIYWGARAGPNEKKIGEITHWISFTPIMICPPIDLYNIYIYIPLYLCVNPVFDEAGHPRITPTSPLAPWLLSHWLDCCFGWCPAGAAVCHMHATCMPQIVWYLGILNLVRT